MQHQDSYIVVKEFTDNGKKTREVIATGVTKQGFIDAYTEKGCVMRGGENPHFEDIYSGIVYKLEKEFEQGGQIDRERDIQIAKTILMQMGGSNRLQMFTGAYNFVAVPYGVSFRIKNRKVNYVKIVLNAMDTYDVEFGLIRGANYKVVKELNGIYNDQLVEVFTRYTGMVLRLRKGGAIQGEENAEMVMNQNLQIRHHTEELEEILKSGKQVPAWVVSKLSRAADSISDATHYLEGTPDKMARGGEVSTQYEAIPNTTYELKIEVYYDKGGMNYFSGGVDKRGYYLSVTPVEIERKENNVMIESYTAFSGVKKLILEVERQSGKSAQKAKELAEYLIPELKQYVLNQMTEKGQIPQANPLPEPEPMPNEGNRIITDLKDFNPITTEIIDGDANFGMFPNITDLGVLQKIGGNASFNDSQVQSLGNLQTIGGYADFRDSQVQDLGNLQTIGDDAWFRGSKVKSLGNLQTIAGDADFRNSKVQSLGNLKKIGSNAYFNDSKVQDLGNLQTIGGAANFIYSQIKNLGNLQTIGGYADFRDSKVQDLGTLQEIGGNVYFGFSKVQDLGNLKTIGGMAYFQDSQVKSLGNLQTIGKDADFRDSQFQDLGNLQTIGGNANFEDTQVQSLGNLQTIGGNANFSGSKIQSLGNLQTISGDVSFENSQVQDLGNLQTIGGDANFYDSQVQDLGNLQTIRKNAFFENSQIEDLGNLKKIGGGAYFEDSQVKSLGNLQKIGSYADFENSRIKSLGNLEAIGGNVNFDNSKVQDLGNLQKIEGDIYWGGRTDLKAEWERRQQNPEPMPNKGNRIITDLRDFDPNTTIIIGGDAHFVRFPNITDLGVLREIRGNADFRLSQIEDLGDLQTIGGMADFRESQVQDLGNLKTIGGSVSFENSQVQDLGNLQTIEGDIYWGERTDLKAEWERRQQNPKPMFNAEQIRAKIELYEEILEILQGEDRNLVQEKIYILKHTLEEMEDGGEDDNNIKSWYISTYPSDELGEDLNPNAEFSELEENLADIYTYLGVSDSIVRERVFERYSEIFNKPYEYIYDKWVKSEKFAKGGGVSSVFSKAKSFGKRALDKSVKLGKSAKEKTEEAIRQTKKKIALDVLYDVKENLAEGRDEQIAVEKAFYVVDDRYAEGGGVEIPKNKSLRHPNYEIVDILKELHSFFGRIKFRTEWVNGVWNIVYEDKGMITKDVLGKLRSNKFWNKEFCPSISVFEGSRVNINFQKNVQGDLNVANFDKQDWKPKSEMNFANGGGVGELPPKGELTNKDNFLLKYEKKGGDYEFYIYKPETKKVSGYNQVKHICVNSDCPLKMTYEQFVNYLYSELYLDDIKYAKGGGVKFPDKFIGNDEIVFLKTKEDLRGANYNLYYKGHNFDGGYRFGSEKELKDFAGNYILSNQWYNKLRYEKEIPLPILNEKYAKGGEVFVCPVGTEIQTLIFDKSIFNLRQAKAWAKKNNFDNSYVDGKLNTLRIRQKDPNLFVQDGFRTIQLRQGVQAVIGCPKRKIRRKR